MPTCAAGDPVVWLNTKSNVYHLSGDKYYGKTKIGKFICASAAKAAGAHPVGASAHRPRTSTGASPAPESTF